jgi:hypothetical protein
MWRTDLPGLPPKPETKSARQKANPLLPYSAKELAAFNQEQLDSLFAVIDRERDRAHGYATESLRVGGVCLVTSMLIFMALVILGHDKAAGVVVGTTVIGAIVKLFGNRF